MASVYKPNEKGKTTPKRGANWRMRFKNQTGSWQDKSSGTTCKQTAMAEANRLETEALKRRNGLVDSRLEAIAIEAKKSVREHVVDYQSKMQNAGLTEKHIAEQVSIVQSLFALPTLTKVSDVQQDSIQSYVSTLVADKKSNRTIQKHIAGLRTFFEWLVGNGKCVKNPTKGIAKPSPSKDRRHQRRMLTRDEWRWLAAITATEPERWNMTGKARRLLYWTAIESGYRSNELRQIVKSNLGTLSGKYFICLDAGKTKNGRSAKQYLSNGLAAELIGYCKSKRPAESLFEMPSKSNVAKMIREDLAAARSDWLTQHEFEADTLVVATESNFLKYEDQEQKKLDFHALRHTCGAWMIIAGVDIKTVQTVMRHSTPTLTLNTYGHLLEGAESRAIQAVGAAPQQIPSKLAANQAVTLAAGCESVNGIDESTNAKSPQKTGGFANQCKIFPILALAPPVGLEPTTNGLTVRRSTN